ncbi:ELMO DOMAIN-CONTAINING PROTEIN A-LIKE ISOFORM X1 [Salix koriyanagi]|uniref:ELMO DOMAIN-CONTAINING PROTEIN A-LIKE ISOFORM X1 n=1 Tax=Salix koriyanagi TaxID=2511006 RepID=A0A9Q0TE09_9ROSI|nr:ELMO DOMAIN-CONTAINING PROTEIN A-LIKE ISOFORM X1 [Salix koriyanagi]
MDGRGGSFVAVRRISQGLERGNNTCHSTSAEVVAGSAAWLGRGLSCVCAQRGEYDARPSFDLTPVQEECLQRLQSRIDVPYDSSVLDHQKSFQDLLQKREGDRSVWEYPFAVAGVNITFMLIQMLDLEAVKPRTLVGATFLKFLAENDSAFDLLYCITFKLMDHEWLTIQASYMDFNAVMKSTRCQLERELLSEDITLLEDLPSYTLLAQ